MNKFKVGDKVKCIYSNGMEPLEVDQEYTVEEVVDDDGWIISVKENPNWRHFSKRFELVQEKKQVFDMKKDKWFIRTPTPEISEAVQLWLFEQGFKWCGVSYKNIAHTNELVLEGTGGDTFGWRDEPERDYKEIKLTFKTSVASVEYPVVETQAEKELKALEQKIQELTEQASKLRSVIK